MTCTPSPIPLRGPQPIPRISRTSHLRSSAPHPTSAPSHLQVDHSLGPKPRSGRHLATLFLQQLEATDSIAGKQTKQPTNKQTNKETSKPAKKQTTKQTGKQAKKQTLMHLSGKRFFLPQLCNFHRNSKSQRSPADPTGPVGSWAASWFARCSFGQIVDPDLFPPLLHCSSACASSSQRQIGAPLGKVWCSKITSGELWTCLHRPTGFAVERPGL